MEPNTTNIAPAPETPKKKHGAGIIIAVAVLLVLAGGSAYAYTAGYLDSLFQSPDKILHESLNTARLAKQVYADTTITIHTAANSTSTSSLASSFLPADITVTSKGNVDMADSANIKTSGTFSVDAGTLSGAFDVRSLDKTLYFRITQAPALLSAFGLGQIINKWVSLSLATATSSFSSVPLVPQTGLATALTEEQKKHILEIANNAHFITFKEKEASEEINGVDSYHFTFDLDKEGIKTYLSELKTYINESGKNDSYLSSWDPSPIEKSLDKIQNFSGNIWIGKKDNLPSKIDTSLSLSSGADSTLTVRLVSLLKDWNVPTSIIAPEGAVSLQNLMHTTMQSSGAPVEDSNSKSYLATFRNEAEYYYEGQHPGNYAGVCSSQSAQNILDQVKENGGTSITCKDTATTYGVSAKLIDGTYWCVDSNGNAKAVKGSITTPSCN